MGKNPDYNIGREATQFVGPLQPIEAATREEIISDAKKSAFAAINFLGAMAQDVYEDTYTNSAVTQPPHSRPLLDFSKRLLQTFTYRNRPLSHIPEFVSELSDCVNANTATYDQLKAVAAELDKFRSEGNEEAYLKTRDDFRARWKFLFNSIRKRVEVVGITADTMLSIIEEDYWGIH